MLDDDDDPEDALKETEHRVEIVNWSPNNPDMNTLNLGFFAPFQALQDRITPTSVDELPSRPSSMTFAQITQRCLTRHSSPSKSHEVMYLQVAAFSQGYPHTPEGCPQEDYLAAMKRGMSPTHLLVRANSFGPSEQGLRSLFSGRSAGGFFIGGVADI